MPTANAGATTAMPPKKASSAVSYSRFTHIDDDLAALRIYANVLSVRMAEFAERVTGYTVDTQPTDGPCQSTHLGRIEDNISDLRRDLDVISEVLTYLEGE